MQNLRLQPSSVPFILRGNCTPYVCLASRSQARSYTSFSSHYPFWSARLHFKLITREKGEFIVPTQRVSQKGEEFLFSQRNQGDVVHELPSQKSASEEQLLPSEAIPVKCLNLGTIHVDDNKLHWRSISQVYGIVAAQIGFCAVISTTIVLSTPVKEFLYRIHLSAAVLLMLLPFLLSWPLVVYKNQYPLNYILLSLLTICTGIDIGLCCAAIEAQFVLQALQSATAGVSSLTGYTFWASKKGKEFSYSGPFLFSCLSVFVMTGIVQLLFPLGSKSGATYAGVVAIVLSGYLVHYMEKMIKRHSFDEYIGALISLYTDIVLIFIDY